MCFRYFTVLAMVVLMSFAPSRLKGETNMTELATFAGGCFWCMQPPFDHQEGVLSTTVGYAGGQVANPSYEQVCSGRTGHTEAIQIEYDPHKVSYKQLLDIFWQNIDPTTENAQFADHGSQYRTAIFYHNEEQKKLALQSKDELEKKGMFKNPIVTEITAAPIFYPAEDYHQDYYQKNPFRYKAYRYGSGRASFLEKTWGSKNSEKK